MEFISLTTFGKQLFMLKPKDNIIHVELGMNKQIYFPTIYQ